jgi:hypothetical protein
MLYVHCAKSKKRAESRCLFFTKLVVENLDRISFFEKNTHDVQYVRLIFLSNPPSAANLELQYNDMMAPIIEI